MQVLITKRIHCPKACRTSMGKGNLRELHIMGFRFVTSIIKLRDEAPYPTEILIKPAVAILAWSKLLRPSVLVTIGSSLFWQRL